MEPISAMTHGPAASAGVREPAAAQASPQKETRPAAVPARDEYTPEEARTPCGLYWMGRDEDGSPRIFFDDPAPKAAPLPEDKSAPAPEGPEQPASGRGEEKCTCDTGKVDREIRQLKKRREQLESRLRTETDETRARELERQLAQVDRELAQKDNDTYRRQRADFS